jgi:hypothetical protein
VEIQPVCARTAIHGMDRATLVLPSYRFSRGAKINTEMEATHIPKVEKLSVDVVVATYGIPISQHVSRRQTIKHAKASTEIIVSGQESLGATGRLPVFARLAIRGMQPETLAPVHTP